MLHENKRSLILKRRSFLIASAAAGIAAAGEAVYGKRPTATQSLRRPKVDQLLEVTQVPAIAIAGAIQGRPFLETAGVRASSGKNAIVANTCFPAASLSKPVFAWAVRDLVKQGKLEWAKPLEDYVKLGLSGDAKRITAEHVLTHSSGLTNWRFQAGKELIAEFTPGSKWQYSGEGIFLLQRVVEKIVDTPIAIYMKKKVLEPLGMTSSTYSWTPQIQTRAASGHNSRGFPLERSLEFFERRNHETLHQAGLESESATFEEIVAAYEKAKLPALPVGISPNMAGSLWTTVEDYPKFLKRVLGDSHRPPGL